MPPTPTLTPTSPANPLPTILHGVWAGIWSAMTSSPIVAIGVWLMVLMVIVRIVRAIALGPIHRDPMRRFSNAKRAPIFARADGRCERHGGISGAVRGDREPARRPHPSLVEGRPNGNCERCGSQPVQPRQGLPNDLLRRQIVFHAAVVPSTSEG